MARALLTPRRARCAVVGPQYRERLAGLSMRRSYPKTGSKMNEDSSRQARRDAREDRTLSCSHNTYSGKQKEQENTGQGKVKRSQKYYEYSPSSAVYL